MIKKKSLKTQSQNDPHLKRPNTWVVVRAVGWVTFIEILRDKVLYNVILCSFILFFIGFLATGLNFIQPERIVLDFGLLTVNVSCAMVSILMGSGLLAKEFDRRTIYVALSHPISRAQFILGKFIGLVLLVSANWLLLVLSFLFLLGLASVNVFDGFSWTLGFALILALIQGVMISSIAILFSTFSTTSLTVIFSIGFYLIGNNVSQLRLLATRFESSVSSFLMNGIASVLPNFEYFNLGLKVTYGLPITWQFIGLSIFYGAFVIALCLVLAGILIQGREV